MSRDHTETAQGPCIERSHSRAARCLAIAITAAGIGSFANPVAALAEPLHISIARQPLASALQQLARQANIQILYSRELVDGRTASALAGDFELKSALDALLADSGLTYSFASNDSVVIKAATAPGSSPRPASDPPAAGAHGAGNAGSAAPLSTNDDLAIEEVIVTARKREESLQSTPIAVSALTANDLESRGITDISQIGQFAPGLSIDETSPFAATSSAAAVFIRGIGISDWALPVDPGVGIYLDGVYISRSIGGVLDLVDLERVEVLRGPQGTLFGRNTIGGAINITSKKPDTDSLHGDVDVTAGRYSQFNVKGKVNIPLGEQAAMSLAVSRKKRDGYVKNDAGPDLGDEDSLAVAASLQWNPTDALSIGIAGDYTREREAPAPWVLVNVDESPGTQVYWWNLLRSGNAAVCTDRTNPARLSDRRCMNAQWIQGPFRTSSAHRSSVALMNSVIGEVAPRSELNLWGLRLTAEYAVTDQLTVKSITGYRKNTDGYWSRDFDHSPLEVATTVNDFNHKQFSQELQLLGTGFDDRLHWIFGLYYFGEKGRHIDVVQLPGPPLWMPEVGVIMVDAKVDNTSKAAFGQFTYDLTPRFHLTLGARYTDEQKRFWADARSVNPTPPFLVLLPKGWKEVSAKRTDPYANLSFDASKDVMLYASYSQGFKGGGFSQRVFPPLNFVPSFEPEVAKVYEVGAKSMLFDDRLQLNLAAYHTDYKDVQVNASAKVFQPTAIGNVLANAAKAKIDGVEMEFKLVATRALRFEGNLAWTDARYSEVSAFAQAAGINSSRHFVNTPKWAGSLAGDYRFELGRHGALTARAEATHTSAVFNDAVNTPIFRQGRKTLLDASLIWEDEDGLWQLRGTVRNLTDKTYITSGLAVNNGLSEATYGLPRTWQVSLKRSFGR